jgi:hypothetical protein
MASIMIPPENDSAKFLSLPPVGAEGLVFFGSPVPVIPVPRPGGIPDHRVVNLPVPIPAIFSHLGGPNPNPVFVTKQKPIPLSVTAADDLASTSALAERRRGWVNFPWRWFPDSIMSGDIPLPLLNFRPASAQAKVFHVALSLSCIPVFILAYRVKGVKAGMKALQTITSWRGYFKHADTYRLRRELFWN